MARRLRELLEQRNRLATRAREILETAHSAGREPSEEEQRHFDQAMADQDRLRVQIEREERLAQVEGELASRRGEFLGDGQGDGPEGRAGGAGTASGRQTAAGVVGEGRYAVRLDEFDPAPRADLERRASSEYGSAFRRYLRTGEMRALDAGSTGANGAYLVTPVQFVQGLLQALDDGVFIRSLATVYSVPNANSLGRVSLDADVDDADWTSELKTGGEDNGAKFGKRELTPHPLAKRIKLSNRLLRIASMDVEGLARTRLAYKFGLTEEKAFLTGDGVQKPLGIFTASDDGVPAGRDVATGNTSTAITFDGLISAKYSLKAGYLARARWLFSRAAITQIAKIRDDAGGAGTGQYIWQPSQQLGQPDRIHGLPVLMSEYVPAVFTTGKYVGAIADFSFYHIADALDMQMQRLAELYAETNQTGLIARKETDGMPVLAEAFTRVKLA